MQIQDYVLGEMLYEGPETRVQRAVPVGSGARLVVKMPVAKAPSQRVIGRLVHEYQILGKLVDVPGVPRAWALRQEGGQPSLWLEDLGLRSLGELLAGRGRLSLEAMLRVALELCRVLEGVHAAGIAHKDIKPQNVLVDDACTRVALVDFAIASELTREAPEASVPEALEGSLAYVSPEQTGRTARGLDTRTDLYSLGVLLFEALSGRPPFVETSPLALVHAHLAKAPLAIEVLVAGVPGAVARILGRCLEKHPEKRYQTAKGLSADLEHCLRMLEAHGRIDEFPLGRKDFSPRLHIPDTLVSREAESREIAAAFERAAQGAVEMLLLEGASGTGKTALVRSVYQEIARAGRGLLISGKHDQLDRSVPYAAIVQAFRGFICSLVASSKPVFDEWRARIDRALGPLARVIADFVLELEWLMGPLPAVPVVSTEMTYNRIKLSWIEFVRAVTDASPPLVLFLDDMQWVDPASLELLKTLLTDVGRKHLLIIAAFRGDEVEPGHPLRALVDSVAESGVMTPRLAVGSLSEAAITQWLALTFSSERERMKPLALALSRKTQGNPFFLGQLLLELHRQQLVQRNLEDGVWHWDQDAVERAAVTDNVIALMQSKVVQLPVATQELLGHAACASHSFSLDELAVLAGASRAQVIEELRPALLAGLVIPSDGQYREVHALARAGQDSEIDAQYRFLHDRVQQAFYERIAPAQRARTHLSIGRRLQQAFEEQGGSNQKQVEMVRHLNLGAGALEDDAERRALARLNLLAAKAAKANGSYRLQATLVEQAQHLLGARAWHEEPALSVELSLERIEADFMLREFDEVHRRARELLALPLPTLPRLCAQELRVRACLASGQYGEGVGLGLAALAELGITYPESDEACNALGFGWLRECEDWLDRHPDGFDDMPPDPSVEHLLQDAIEAGVVLCAAFGVRPGIPMAAATRNVRQSTERGALTRVTPLFIVFLANGHSVAFDDPRGAVRWARQGARAATRIGSPLVPECSVFRGFYETYALPVERSREHYQAALRVAMTSGSFQGTGWALGSELLYVDLWSGRSLEHVAKQERANRDRVVRSGDALGQRRFALVKTYAASLRASRRTWPPAGEDWLSPSSRSFLDAGDGYHAELARIVEAHLFLAFGEHARALEHADEADRLRSTIFGIPLVADIPLWRGLSAARCWSSTLAQEHRAALLAKLEHAIARVRYFSDGCAESFLHKLCLLEAEHARIHGKTDLAMASYDQAITLAHNAGFLHIEALAAHLCADFHLQAGRERIGALYLREARDAYTRWGARALVEDLESRYSAWLAPSAPAATARSLTATDVMEGAELDVGTVVRAAQALSSDLDLTRVVSRLMDLVLENAGAQRGVLLLAEGESLVVVARLSVDGARVETGLLELLDHGAEIAATVVHYVARSREPLVVNDAQTDERFRGDPYLATHVVRSLLALPLAHRGRLVGVLYLEHRAAPLAFTPARVALLSVLASQAAIAVENASLYRNMEAQVRMLEARNREVQQLNDELRRQIAQRSRRFLEAFLSSEPLPPASSRLQVGSLLGDCYRVVRPIGEGGMGSVYEVERTTDGVRLAAKVLNRSPDRSALGRFAREAQILASLNHPNLISIFDVDLTSEGGLYIVMELVSGGSLRQASLRFGDARWGLSVLQQVAEALSVLHARSIVHRDLKPENVLVTSAAPGAPSVVKLVDFGVSIMLDAAPVEAIREISMIDAQNERVSMVDLPASDTPVGFGATVENRNRLRPMLTETGVVVGTPLYMAPELVHGSKTARPPSDVFSLGVMAFELLAGAMPFELPPVFLAAAAGALSVPNALRQRLGSSPEIAELFERCLHVEPGQRPSAQQIATLLARYHRSVGAG